MTITPEIFDWPVSVRPATSLFRAPRQASADAYTAGGAAIYNAEPGGRAFYDMTFNTMKSHAAGRRASGLMSMLGAGTVWRVPIRNTPQIVSAAELALGISTARQMTGIPWDNGRPWDNDMGWEFEPGVTAAAAALYGTTELKLADGGFGDALQWGHLVGHRSAAYKIFDIAYTGGVATLKVSPPLRYAVTVGDFITFRPSVLATAQDIDQFKALFDQAGNIRPGNLTMMEAIP